MISRLIFETVKTTLCDIRDNDKIMAGITVVLVGDIRPVFPKRPKAAKPKIHNTELWTNVMRLD